MDEDPVQTTSKKFKLEPAQPSTTKGTHSEIVPPSLSACNGLAQPSDQTQPNSDNLSNQINPKHVIVEAKPRRKLRARRPGCLSTPRITDWLLSCPSPKPVLSQSTCDSIPAHADSNPPSPKKKRTRRNRRSKNKNKTHDSSSLTTPDRSNLLPFLTPAVKKDDPMRRRPSSMSPELRQRQISEDHASFVPTNEKLQHVDGPSKEA